MNKFAIIKISAPESWLIDAAASIGLDLTGLIHEITNYFENHGIKKHGNETAEKAQGQLPIRSADIMRIADIIKKPDTAIIGIQRRGETLIAYSKKFADGTIIYYETILNSKRNKALRGKTMFKKMGSVDKDTFLKIVTNNSHTDVSQVKMVVGAGGNPGGEA